METHPAMRRAASTLLPLIPWLKLLGACVLFLLVSLDMAAQSELGRQISAGESPAFSWAKRYARPLLSVSLVYALAVLGLQHLASRLRFHHPPPGMTALVWMELGALGVLAWGLSQRTMGAVSGGHLWLQMAMLSQLCLSLESIRRAHPAVAESFFPRHRRSPVPTLTFFLLLAALPAALDPSWRHLLGQAGLDSSLDLLLSHVLPLVLSGVVAWWLGIAILLVLAVTQSLWERCDSGSPWRPVISLLPFLTTPALCAAVTLASVASAMQWELSTLQLQGAVAPLFVLLSGGGGALTYAAFQRLRPLMPRPGGTGPLDVLALSMGAALVFPLTWLLTRPGSGRRAWRLLLGGSMAGSLGLAYVLLYGGLLNPWFTALSFLKGALLKLAALVAAGTLRLLVEEVSPSFDRPPAPNRGAWVVAGLTCVAGFPAFAALDEGREAKAVALQFRELSRVDAVYARTVAHILGLGDWVRLGQDPGGNGRPDPWPLPWTLRRTAPSQLPKDFNLVVIVVDALRGDAFRSAGYHRNLTPFLDAWALQKAVSFRRAYTQGGGTFAALPFLVAGRSRLSLYGPDLHRQNLYFLLAQAEGIRHLMITREGPRHIFPPEFPLIQLGDGGHEGPRRSAPAGQVFAWLEDAVLRLGTRERFFAYLQLMDVHNDLWKKADGLDFGDSPRDLYDNNLSSLDRAFQRFVAWLREQGIYRRTVILFTADHGEQFWEHGASLHGHTLFEEEIRIPLILLAHGVRARLETIPAVAADMAPTLVELAGYTVDPPYDDPHMGISLVPLLLGRERDRYLTRDVVGRASFGRRYFLYRNWEWKLVYFAELDLLHLYNTRVDPWEQRNLLQENPGMAAEMERELLGYLDRVEGKTYRPLLSPGPGGH